MGGSPVWCLLGNSGPSEAVWEQPLGQSEPGSGSGRPQLWQGTRTREPPLQQSGDSDSEKAAWQGCGAGLPGWRRRVKVRTLWGSCVCSGRHRSLGAVSWAGPVRGASPTSPRGGAVPVFCPSREGPPPRRREAAGPQRLQLNTPAQGPAGPLFLGAQGRSPGPQPLVMPPWAKPWLGRRPFVGWVCTGRASPLGCPDLQGGHTGPYGGHGQEGVGTAPCQYGACVGCTGPGLQPLSVLSSGAAGEQGGWGSLAGSGAEHRLLGGPGPSLGS